MNVVMRQKLTHSRLASFRACPRRHYLRYELGLVSEADSFSRKVGSAFARAVEAAAKGLDVEAAILAGGFDDPYDFAIVAAMFDAHERQWAGEELEHVAAELQFSIPFVNPETGARSPIWDLDGKIDRIVRLPDGRLAIMEYKSTSKDFSPGSDYWVRLHLDYQLSIYLIAARELGYDVSTILYDVTRRPSIRPQKATPVEERKYTQRATKLKDGTVKPAGSLHADQREADETPEEFARRAGANLSDPEKLSYTRVEIARLDQDIEETRAELWAQQLAIREAQRSGRWYRNPEACFGQGFKCDMVPICQFNDLTERTPEGFRRVSKEDIHSELSSAKVDVV